MLEPVLTYSHCQSCRKCCIFDEEEIVDAPLFTPQAKDRVVDEFPGSNIEFRQRGRMWQIQLHPHSADNQYACPLYEVATGRCRIHHYKPFDCASWPIYIMIREERIFLTISPICPAFNHMSRQDIVKFVETSIGPRMVDEAKIWPEIVAAYRTDVIDLYEVLDVDLIDCVRQFRIESRLETEQP